MAVVSSVAGCFWLLMSLLALWGLREFRRLPPLDPDDDLSDVLVSVIVPARIEEARIEGTLRRLLDQQGAGIRVEVIAVDDRSTDRTPEILDRLEREHERLSVVHVDELPPGWLGKCHACHLGERQARGDWLLFVDADSHVGPEVVARAVQTARREGASHFCLAPGFLDCTLSGQVILLLASVSLAQAALGMNRDWRHVSFGVGAFNMARRGALEELGGYERLRMEVVDDVGLGAGIKRLGHRSRIYTAFEEVEVHWGHSATNFIQVLEKNHFAVLGYRTGLSLTLTSLVMLLWLAGFTGWFALSGLFSLVLPSAILVRRHGWSWWVALLVPLSVPVLVWAMVNSTLTTIRQGGVRWRDTFYSLAELRAARQSRHS